MTNGNLVDWFKETFMGRPKAPQAAYPVGGQIVSSLNMTPPTAKKPVFDPAGLVAGSGERHSEKTTGALVTGR